MSTVRELADLIVPLVRATGISEVKLQPIGQVKLTVGNPPREITGFGILFTGSPAASYLLTSVDK